MFNKIKYIVFASLIIFVVVNTKVTVNRQSKTDTLRKLATHSTPFRALKASNRIYGSGSYISYKGKHYILTNRHICLAGQTINNNLTHIQVDKHVAKIIKIAAYGEGDLCILESNRKSGLEVTQVAPQPLDHVTLIGFPRGIGKVIRQGRIIRQTSILLMGSDFTLRNIASTQISATAYPGNSGSPALDANGFVIGVLFAGSPQYPHEPFIVPHNQLIQFLDSLTIKLPIKLRKKDLKVDLSKVRARDITLPLIIK